MADVYDVIVIGAGVVGAATAWELAEFTGVKRIAVVDKEAGVARVSSNRRANSQTLHPFGGELNYDLDTMKRLKRIADMVLDYVNSRYGRGYDVVRRLNGLVLAVGEEEVDYLQRKFHSTVKRVFPGAELMGRGEIGELEPYVVKGRRSEEGVGGIRLRADMVDFGELAKSLIENTLKRRDKRIEIKLNRKVERIERVQGGYEVHMWGGGRLLARYLIIAAGSYTLSLAKRLGLGEEYVVFPVEGRFFYSKPVINGKVYTVQEEGVPFANVHADRDWGGNFTRYGPTASFTLMFEKGRVDLEEFVRNLDPALMHTVSSIQAVRNHMLRNSWYSIPIAGRRLFWEREVKKIVPSLPYEDLEPAVEWGGIRAVAVERRTGRPKLGELILKKEGENVMGDVSPSPGASASLGIAYKNVLGIVEALDSEFYEDKFTEVFGTLPTDRPS